MKKSLLWVLFSALFSCAVSFAAEPIHWEFAGWHGGGCYPNIEFDPLIKNRVYLTSDVAGLWKSDDGGENWSFATKGLGHLNIPVLAIAPSDSNVIYAGTGMGVFVSRDAANTWNKTGLTGSGYRFSRPENYRSILVSRLNPSRVIAGTALGEIWISEDFGVNWDKLGASQPFSKKKAISCLLWDEDAQNIYASSDEGLALFSWKNKEWLKFSESPKKISDFIKTKKGELYAAGQSAIHVSQDGGKTWFPRGLAPKGIFFRLAEADSKGKLIAAYNQGWKGRVAHSFDEGYTWKDVTRGNEDDKLLNPTRFWAGTNSRVDSLKVDPFNANIIFKTDIWGVWKSEDQGIIWKEKINGAPNTVTSDILIASTGDIYVATMDNGLLRSSDGGKTYQALFPKEKYKDDEGGHVWRVVEALDGSILATSSPWNVKYDQVIFSRNGSAPYEKITAGLPKKRPQTNTVWNFGYARALAVDPKNSNNVYLGIDGDDGGGFFVSLDGGRSWKRSEGQPGSLKIYNGLAVDPHNPNKIFWGAAGSKGGVYLSVDQGRTWKYVFKKMKNVFDVAISGEGIVYAAGDYLGPSLFMSQDGGQKWKMAKRFGKTGTAESLCVLPDGRVALGILHWNSLSGGEIYLGFPEQNKWDKINGDLPEGEGPAAMAYHPNEKALYMARFAGSVYKRNLKERQV